MSPTLNILSFPRELRDQIYTAILKSSTGIVILLPSPYPSSNPAGKKKLIIQEFTPWAQQEYTLSSKQRITLNVIKSCKQVYEETKGLFWRLNRVWGGDVSMWRVVQEVRGREVLEGRKEVTLKEWENSEKEEDVEMKCASEGRTTG